MSRIGAVAIGRNEGDRLRRCLTSLKEQAVRLVYVDSGSTDDSVAFARSLGIEVVQLDLTMPFTAARGRNAGAEALLAAGDLDYIQFVDGDCAVEPGWIAAASDALDADPTLGIVTGWRTEIDPGRNIYHALCEVEWHRPAGIIPACGGDMMVRVAAFRTIGGFNAHIIAGEDEEFCLRMVRVTGLRILRLPRIMTHHDVNTSRLSEWWRRQVRTGHAFAEVARMEPPHYKRERRRVWLFGLILPLLAILGLVTGTWWLLALAIAVTAASWVRTARALAKDGLAQGAFADLPGTGAWRQAAFLTLSKFPNLQGFLTYYLRRWRGADMRIIEYK